LILFLPFSVFVGSAGLESNIIPILSLACALFGQGFQNGAGLLLPLAMPLSICASVLDIAWIMFAIMLIAERNEQRAIKKARNFI